MNLQLLNTHDKGLLKIIAKTFVKMEKERVVYDEEFYGIKIPKFRKKYD